MRFFSALLGIVSTLAADQTDWKQLSQDHRTFACSLYQQVAKEETDNLVFSPYSIATSLEMLLVGARKETADAIQRTLHLSFDPTELPALATQLRNKLFSNSLPLQSANALWLGDEFFILTDYAHTIERGFQGKITRLDFRHPDKARDTINQWISKETQGKIKSLIQDSDLQEETCLVLTNAVAFQGNWQSRFDPILTTAQAFYTTPETSVSIPMMKQTGTFPYFETPLLQILALPFQNSGEARLACVFLLPRSQENLFFLESDLNNSLDELLKSLTDQSIQVQLPKFTFTQRINLQDTLQALDLEIPFTTQANFSGIDGKLDLYVNAILHQAFFSLDEQGVEAAAASAAAIGVKSIAPPQTQFTADHPFIFLLADLTTREILFLGKFQKPTTSEADGRSH